MVVVGMGGWMFVSFGFSYGELWGVPDILEH